MRNVFSTMASAWDVPGISNRDVCSICFESYRNQVPKILPCFHTFCKPCLEQMFKKAALESAKVTSYGNQTNNDGSRIDGDVFINCPTCRKSILIPPGGVAEFQSNFYIQQEGSQGHVQPIICDVCDKDQVASHLCTKCQQKLCFHCHQTHCNSCQVARQPPVITTDKNEKDVSQMLSRGQDQLKVLKRAMTRQAQEEKELNKQRKVLEDELLVLYTDGLARLADAKEEMLRNIRSHTEAEQSKAKVEMAKLQAQHDILSNFTSSDDVSSVNAVDLKAALMPDSELCRLQKEAERVQFFKHTFEKKRTGAIVNDLRELIFGSLEMCVQIRDGMTHSDSQNLQHSEQLSHVNDEGKTLSEAHEKPRSDISDADSAMKDSRVENLVNKVDFLMKQTAESSSERRKLHIENRSLADDFYTFRDKNSIIVQEMASMQAENHKLVENFTRLEAKIQHLSQDSEAARTQTIQKGATTTEMQQEIQSLNSNALAGDGTGSNSTTGGKEGGMDRSIRIVGTDMDAQKIQFQELQQQVSSLKKAMTKSEGKLSRLDTRVESLSRPVFFHARLDRDVRTRSSRPLIFKDVLSNVGDDYAEHTGKFEVSVTGTYLFLASVTPIDEDKCAEIRLIVSDLTGEWQSDDEDSEQAYLSNAEIDTTSTCQCVMSVEAGQAVWVETDSQRCSFKKYQCYFSGMLLQPEI